MALIELEEKVKAVIVVVINLVATGILGFSAIYGWDLQLWAPITAMVVLVLDTILGIQWVAPARKRLP